MKHLKKASDGMIMIESLIVFIITTFLLMLVIAMFGAMFQRWNIQTAANDAAAKLAQTYGYSEIGSQAIIETGEISSAEALNVRPYRYMINRASFEEDAKERARVFAEKQVKKTLIISSGSEIDVEAEIKSDFLGRRHAEVTITNKFVVPYQIILETMGIGNVTSFTVTGYADCVDLLDYLNTIAFIEHTSDYLDNTSDTIELISSIMEMVSNFF